MTTAQQRLTPAADRTPAIVRLPAKELSGAMWVARFPGSASLDELAAPFKDYACAFIDALRNAGASVTIAATYRPTQRAYLMHWSWSIVKRALDARTVPTMEGVDIQWDHCDDDGIYSSELSLAAASAMVNAYATNNLRIAPALVSRHTARSAIDMSIQWNGLLTLEDAFGNTVAIDTVPRTGMNARLQLVGVAYGIIKYNRRGEDRPHWSDTGA